MPIPNRPDIVSLGFVSEQDKYDGIAAATLVVAPSPYESLSMVCLEAWQIERAVLANGHSEVLLDQVQRSGGGRVYYDAESFAVELDAVLKQPDLRTAYGISGREFVERTYRWELIDAQYEDVIRAVAQGQRHD